MTHPRSPAIRSAAAARRLAGRFVRCLALATAGLAAASGAQLDITGPTGLRHYETGELLADPAVQTIDIPADVAYGRPMRFRALPLAPLLAAAGFGPDDTIEAVALDGYVAQLPAALVLADAADGAQAWLAIEPPDAPWPPLPTATATASAGPFYVIWREPQAGGVTPEQWPFQVRRLASVLAPAQRWPDLQAPAGAGAEVLRGQAVFVQHCLPCHRLDGGGNAGIGPDLNRPMSPVEYFRPGALRRYLRDPAAVRNWPGQGMPGFAPAALPDADLDALLAYFAAKAAAR